ncbi:hypothetical protein ASZ90_008431 [hydrocarbon metagenome]|uniref:Uncharacterized protein n=1 Tax=hydrocarbon metagenome TaxID=938273 RepID=A0A0W8FN97_9ZZZZ
MYNTPKSLPGVCLASAWPLNIIFDLEWYYWLIDFIFDINIKCLKKSSTG